MICQILLPFKNVLFYIILSLEHVTIPLILINMLNVLNKVCFEIMEFIILQLWDTWWVQKIIVVRDKERLRTTDLHQLIEKFNETVWEIEGRVHNYELLKKCFIIFGLLCICDIQIRIYQKCLLAYQVNYYIRGPLRK